MKIKKHLRSTQPDVDEYISELEDYILDFDTSSIKQFLVGLDGLCMTLAEDVAIATGEKEGELKILSDDRDDKLFDRLMLLISKVKQFEDVSNIAQALKPEVEELRLRQEQGKTAIQLTPNENGYEQIQKKVKARLSGKAE